MKKFRIAFWLAAAAWAASAACAPQSLDLHPSIINIFSPKEDIQTGFQASAEVDKQLALVTDPQVVGYINRLGHTLVKFEPVQADYPWTFKVVNSEDINAFALPGGFIYVDRGAIEAAEDEAQLAGVIGHETGHVVLRHGTHQATEVLAAKLPLAILGAYFGQGGGLLGQLTQMGLAFGANSILLHNSRSAESEADQVGTYVLYHAGYDPRAMMQFFEIIQRKYPQRTIQFFSDHPNPENRIQDVEEEIPKLGPPVRGKTDSSEFEAIKKRLLAMPPPPKPANTSQNLLPDQGSGISLSDGASSKLRFVSRRMRRVR